MNSCQILSFFLTLLKVKYTSVLKKNCWKLPFMDTLYGYSSLLKRYKVDNLVIDMAEQKTDLVSCQLPAIVPFGEGFVIVYQISESVVSYWEEGKRRSSSLDDFLQKWSGVILLAEKTDFSVEPDYKRHLMSQFMERGCLLLILASICFCICAIIVKNTPYSIAVLSSLVLNMAGAYVSFLLYQKDFRLSRSYVDKICTFIKSGSCDDVINSAEAKLFGIISWSQIGLGYFLSNILLLLAFPLYYIFFFCLSILALPYSFGSIWCQKVKLKRWCVLCLVVQALLWVIFLHNLFFHDKLVFPTDIWSWPVLFMIYSVPFSLLFLYSLSRNEDKGEKEFYQRLLKLKYNEDIFGYVLHRSDKYLDYKEASSILIGNKNAKIVISFITNLYCVPCAYMHSRIKALEGELESDVCIQYIFFSPTEEIEKYTKRMINLYRKEGESGFLYGLDCWFKNDKTKIDNEIESISNNFEYDLEDEYMKHKSFIDKHDIHSTPTILINGCVLPDLYKVEDLIYLI